MSTTRLTVLLASLAVTVALAGDATAQTTKILMFADGVQGDDGTVDGSADLLAYAHSFTVPVDVQRGAVSGARQHQPVYVLKDVNAGTPVFARRLAMAELINRVRFEFYTIDNRGLEVHFFTVELENARVASRGIAKTWTESGDPTMLPVEELEVIYETIRWRDESSGAEFSDMWGGEARKTFATAGPRLGAPGHGTEVEVTDPSGAVVQLVSSAKARVARALLSLPPGDYLYRLSSGRDVVQGTVCIPSTR